MGVSQRNDNGKKESRRNAWSAKKKREPQSLLYHASPQGTAHDSAMAQFYALIPTLYTMPAMLPLRYLPTK